MKGIHFKTLAIILSIFILSSCDKEEGSCYDPVLAENHSGACYKIYDPVCGCDGVTYGNDCMAESKGIRVFTQGACP